MEVYKAMTRYELMQMRTRLKGQADALEAAIVDGFIAPDSIMSVLEKIQRLRAREVELQAQESAQRKEKHDF